MNESPAHTARAALITGRIVLGVASLLLTMIGLKYILDPVGSATASGMTSLSSLGVTNMRAGVGGFALGFALIAATCALVASRTANGLFFLIVVFGTVLFVRLVGALNDGTIGQSARIIIPETVILIAAGSSLAFMSMARKKWERS